jgi:hypothetical protein
VQEAGYSLIPELRAGLILRTEQSYAFLHDRVQEAAYSLIPENVRAETHLRIGNLLAARILPEKREETVFEIVNQLNRGSNLITSAEERRRLAALNLMAGKRAKSSTAYASALLYLRAARPLLTEARVACGGTPSSVTGEPAQSAMPLRPTVRTRARMVLLLLFRQTSPCRAN